MADYRPYYTIHDPDFSTTFGRRHSPSEHNDPSNSPPPTALLAASNPIFRKELAAWPNIISILDEGNNEGKGGGGHRKCEVKIEHKELASASKYFYKALGELRLYSSSPPQGTCRNFLILLPSQ